MNETTHVNDTYVWVEAVLFSPRFYPSVCETRKDSGKSSVCADVIESTAWVFRRAPEAMCLQSSSSFAEALETMGVFVGNAQRSRYAAGDSKRYPPTSRSENQHYPRT